MLTLRRLRCPAALGDAGGVGEGGMIMQVGLVARVALVAQAATAARAAGRRPGRSRAARAAQMLAAQCCWRVLRVEQAAARGQRGCRAGGVDGRGWPWRWVALAARAAQT